jgi:hypothetical protein
VAADADSELESENLTPVSLAAKQWQYSTVADNIQNIIMIMT